MEDRVRRKIIVYIATSASRHRAHHCESHIQKTRSRRPTRGRLERRRSRASCCRSARFSRTRSVRAFSAARRVPSRASRRDIATQARLTGDQRPAWRPIFWPTTGVLDERSRRRWAAVEAMSLGYGGESLVAAATGISRPTIRAGKAELASGEDLGDRIRRPGAGRPSLEEKQPGIRDALERLVDPLTRGDPEAPLRWTTKSKEKLSAALREKGNRMSATAVGLGLRAMGYSLRSVRKTREGSSHPDRNAQFEHINATAERYQRRNQPVISVDTKKKELVGDFKNGGKEWQPEGRPENVLVHDCPGDSLGKAIPYGVYDMTRNEAWVSVGRDHDTPKFAVASIRQWWKKMGVRSYPGAKELFITADAGGSNGYR